MKERKLALRRETVTELGPDDLGRLAGGLSGPTCHTCVVDCVTPLLIPEIGTLPSRACITPHSATECLSGRLCG